jgi:hypothetical protein
VANAVHLGKATLRGVGEVWEGLIDAGSTMIDGASNATTSVVEKRFVFCARLFFLDAHFPSSLALEQRQVVLLKMGLMLERMHIKSRPT